MLNYKDGQIACKVLQQQMVIYCQGMISIAKTTPKMGQDGL
jgi:hypothetical protein